MVNEILSPVFKGSVHSIKIRKCILILPIPGGQDVRVVEGIQCESGNALGSVARSLAIKKVFFLTEVAIARIS